MKLMCKLAHELGNENCQNESETVWELSLKGLRTRPGRKTLTPLTLSGSSHEQSSWVTKYDVWIQAHMSAEQYGLLSQGTFLNIMENKLVGVYSKEVMTWVCAVWLKITVRLRSDVLYTGTEEILRRCGRKIHKVIYENVISTSENCSMSRGSFHFLRCSFLCHLRRYFKMIKWHI